MEPTNRNDRSIEIGYDEEVEHILDGLLDISDPDELLLMTTVVTRALTLHPEWLSEGVPEAELLQIHAELFPGALLPAEDARPARLSKSLRAAIAATKSAKSQAVDSARGFRDWLEVYLAPDVAPYALAGEEQNPVLKGSISLHGYDELAQLNWMGTDLAVVVDSTDGSAQVGVRGGAHLRDAGSLLVIVTASDGLERRAELTAKRPVRRLEGEPFGSDVRTVKVRLIAQKAKS